MSIAIDKNQIQFKIPNNWGGKWTTDNRTFKFKPNYMYYIGEGMISTLTDSDYNNAKLNFNSQSTKLKDYIIDKKIVTVDMYGVNVNEYTVLIKRGNKMFLIKAYYEMCIKQDMEKGLNDMISTFVIK
jgi:hypothetical protein